MEETLADVIKKELERRKLVLLNQVNASTIELSNLYQQRDMVSQKIETALDRQNEVNKEYDQVRKLLGYFNK